MASLPPTHAPDHRSYPAKAAAPKWKSKVGTTTERGYGHAWRKRRLRILERDRYLCQVCKRQGRVTEATEVDHVKPKHEGGTDEDANLQAICGPCHAVKSQTEMGTPSMRPLFKRKPLIPVTIVCGPSGAGKSRYVRERAGPSDLVLDLDVIQARISGMPMYQCGDKFLHAAIAERNARLAALANPSKYARCWLIVGAPTWSERRTWCEVMAGESIVLAVPADECLRRIQSDPSRRGKDWAPIVRQWWARYSAGHDVEVLHA